jgi:hypothetical protein
MNKIIIVRILLIALIFGGATASEQKCKEFRENYIEGEIEVKSTGLQAYYQQVFALIPEFIQ